jgi:glutamate---cysteine ligase / carboxylate-amine ligase
VNSLPFTPSEPYTVGVELELQLVNTETYNLTTDAQSLLRQLEREPLSGEVKPEVTQSMIELNSSVHTDCALLLGQLEAIRDCIVRAARQLNIAVCGGGAHPFQRWNERRIFPGERFQMILEKYGFLAKQFTVFGQHIHIGCRDGDDALYLAHALGRFVPHFVALSAASPFYQGEDTQFDSSRLSVVNAFPLSGVLPLVQDWRDFEVYFDKVARLGVVQSMKDFYWDIRPKPEYGTVEIRVCDTPLTVQTAAVLAAFAQALSCYLLEQRPSEVAADHYLVYSVNRFQASRHGLRGEIIDPTNGERRQLDADLRDTLRLLEPYGTNFGSRTLLDALAARVAAATNDAKWLRDQYERQRSLPDVVRRQCAQWAEQVRPDASLAEPDLPARA